MYFSAPSHERDIAAKAIVRNIQENNSTIFRKHARGFLIALAFVATIFLTSASALAENISLAWDPSPSPNIVSYRLYYGTSSRAYTSVIDAGPTTSATVSNLVAGTTYYFAATAVDGFGLESDFSAEFTYTPSLVTTNPPKIKITPGKGHNKITATAAPSSSYTIQATDDMTTWKDLAVMTANTAGEMEYIDPVEEGKSLRFYRLQKK